VPQDAEQTVIFLHHVRIGDLLCSGPLEVRAWMRERYDEGPWRELAERSSSGKHSSSRAHRWIPRVDGADGQQTIVSTTSTSAHVTG
jgi:hypothetical protein